MIAARSWVLVMSAALMVAGCSKPHSRAKTTAPAARPTTTAASAFCLDLTTFQVGVVVFRGDVVGMVRGQRPDLKELRRKATVIAFTGKEMRASAPPDIAAQFQAVLKAVRASASHLKPGATVGDVVRPVFNDHVNPAFDAVDRYKCH